MERRVAIVTAASRGMGAATARELARRKYALVLLATSDGVVDLARELDGIAVKGSVTEPADLKRLVETALDRHGRIDALVNNTGHPPASDLLAISDADWREGFDIALMNVIRLARLVTPHMKKGGSIVNV
jgi:NAD(P)-dependent dehydrogenase (short-subunit alcohol dehydrogenase family)